MAHVAGAKAGWYPDYESTTGGLRYWDGERWTDRRRRAEPRIPPAWPYAVAAVVVVVLLVVFVIARLGGDDEPDQGAKPPPAQPTSAPTDDETDGTGDDPSSSPSSSPSATDAARLWEVDDVIDSVTLELTNGTFVRLHGLDPLDDELCAADAADQLAELVVGSEVTLVRKGADKDDEGSLLRYVDRAGVDVGLRMIQRGLANASEDPNPRRAIYQRVDDRSPDAC